MLKKEGQKGWSLQNNACLYPDGCIIFSTQWKCGSPCSKIIKTLKMKATIKNSLRHFWVQGPVWMHRSNAQETDLTCLLHFPLKCQNKKILSDKFYQVSLHVNKQ